MKASFSFSVILGLLVLGFELVATVTAFVRQEAQVAAIVLFLCAVVLVLDAIDRVVPLFAPGVYAITATFRTHSQFLLYLVVGFISKI